MKRSWRRRRQKGWNKNHTKMKSKETERLSHFSFSLPQPRIFLLPFYFSKKKIIRRNRHLFIATEQRLNKEFQLFIFFLSFSLVDIPQEISSKNLFFVLVTIFLLNLWFLGSRLGGRREGTLFSYLWTYKKRVRTVEQRKT